MTGECAGRSAAEPLSPRSYGAIRGALLLLLWVAVFWPIMPALWDVWMFDSNNSHGVLVPVIAAFLIWQRRKEIPWAAAHPSLWGLGLLAASLVIYLVSLRAHIAFSARLAMVISLAGLVWWNMGSRVGRQLLFPLAYLAFMVPVPVAISGAAAFPLQLFATSVSAQMIRGVGIPVLEEGTMLYFATTSLEVSEACSGIRSLLAYLTIGVLFTHLAGNTINRTGKGILLFSTIPLALLMNIFRVSGTGVLATIFGGGVARGFLHDFSGLVLFGIGFLLFWAESVILQRWTAKRRAVCPVGAMAREAR
jgi:exosortase